MRLSHVCQWITTSLAIALAAGGCGEDTPVGSGESSGEVTATIGPSGGSLTTSDFSLVIPAGAFASSNTITLTPLTAVHPFGSNGVSRLFGVVGIPAEFSSALTLTIVPTSPGTGRHFVAVGKNAPSPGPDSICMVFSFLNASDSAGRYTCLLPARGTGQGSPSGLLARTGRRRAVDEMDIFIAIAGYDTTTYFNFVMYAPTFVTRGVKIGTLTALNYARALLLDMGLPFIDASSQNQIEAIVYRPSGQTNIVALYMMRSTRLDADPFDSPFIALNCDMMVGAEEKRIIAQCGREAFFFVPEAIYAPMGYSQYMVPDKYWLYVAIGSWFEEKATQDPSHVPSELTGNELQPLQGILAGAGQSFSTSRLHGLGMSALIKYLVTRYREDLIWRVTQELQRGLRPIDALLAGVGYPPSDWYGDFLEHYLSGLIYSVPSQKFLDGVHGTARIRTAQDTLFVLPVSSPDLSARMFLVDLDYPGIDGQASLRVMLDPPAALGSNAFVMVFGVENGRLVYWQRGNDVLITKLRDLTAAGQKVLVAVVNSSCEKPYDVPLDATVRLRVEKPGEGPFRTASVSVSFWAINELPGDPIGTLGQSSYTGDYRPGTFVGNTFTANWNDGGKRGQLVITSNLASGTPNLSYFRLDETRISGSDTVRWTIASKPGIAFNGQDISPFGYSFVNEGASNADLLEMLELYITSPDGLKQRTKEISWTGSSYLNVSLRKY